LNITSFTKTEAAAATLETTTSYTKNSDLQNEAIKSMFSSNPDNATHDDQVKLVKVRQAWAASPEAVEVVRRRKKESNLNLINNNGSGAEMQELKRRSYHPQDYLSQVLHPASELTRSTTSRDRRTDFPKVTLFLVT
jgi:hypothetical protein